MKQAYQLAALATGLLAGVAAQAAVAVPLPAAQVPVPGVLALIGAGVLALYLVRRR